MPLKYYSQVVHGFGDVHIEGVELVRMGQQTLLGMVFIYLYFFD